MRLAPVAAAVVAIGFFLLPRAGMPAFYESFLYMIFFWIALATSWNILGGYANYLSFGHAAFFGAGVYTSATLSAKFGLPFLWTLPVAAAISALLAAGVGAVVFRLNSLRGELFALITMAVAFIVATIIINTPIDGGGGVYLLSVKVPALGGSQTTSIYLMGLCLAAGSVAIAYVIAQSRLGLGLFAIHDDEDVAEVKGVPTFRYKMIAFSIGSAIAGMVGGVHALYVGYVTVTETFSITVPLYVVLMSVLGGTRHWLGPVVGAGLIAASLYAFTSGDQAMIGRAVVAAALIVTILVLPDGIVPTLLRSVRRRGSVAAPGHADVERTTSAPTPLYRPNPDAPKVLEIVEASKSFGGLQALRGVSLDVREGEILGLVGPNGSGKTTLINMISGHFALSGGTITVAGRPIGGLPAHAIAGRGVARTYQIPRPFMHLTVLDNVVMAATFGGPPAGRGEILAEARRWLDFTGLGHKEHLLPADLNLHERKFLELARAMAARPRLLLLDEVLSGLNPAEVDRAIELIRQIRAQGATIVFVEHLMRAVVELSDRVAVLNEGKLFALGAPRAVMSDPEVVSIYLGKAYAA